MASKPSKPTSGKKRKDKDARGGRDSGDGPWLAVYGTLGAAAVVVASALLITGAKHWRQRSEAAAKATGALSAEEQMKLMGHKVELQDLMDDVAQKAENLQEQRRRAEQEKAELEQLVANAQAKMPEQLGPTVMTAQADLISRLLEMVQEVEALKGEGREEERFTVSRKIEAELADLEAAMPQEVGSAVGKQQAALIALVRSALQSERDGVPISDEEWNEENLAKKHGLITYASEVYWEEAYSGGRYGDSFEWYVGWEDRDTSGRSLADMVRPVLKQGARNLVVGCGNSNLSAVLHEEGYRPVVSVDVSEAVISQMKLKYEGVEDMEWRTMDVTKMDFGDSSFDFAVEKGLFDALYAGAGDRVQAALAEVTRVLRPGAHFVSVSFSADRLQRLFGPQEASLDCRLDGSLTYAPSAQDEKGHTVHVYICERRA